jgi:TraM recognition site of TraD and TraG/Helicase HerA, central domain
VLAKGYKMLEQHKLEVVLELSPENHDKKMEELLSLLADKGLKNTLEILASMGNPHLEDDFHRFLVQYIKSGMPMGDIAQLEKYSNSLRHTLFEVALSTGEKEEEKGKALKELISGMEQFYAGMISSVAQAGDSFTIEISNSEGGEESVFYVSVPDAMSDLFEKQILSIFPKAKLFEKKDDYNIFNYDGETVAMEGKIHGNPIFPIKTYDKFDFDPLNVVLNTFSKIDKDGEGASIQIVLRPDHENYLEHYKEALRDLEKGGSAKKALDVQHTMFGQFAKTLKEFGKEAVKDIFSPSAPKNPNQQPTNRASENQTIIEQIKEKISTPILQSNIRIIASAKSSQRAYKIAYDLVSAFNQFENTFGSKFSFEEIKNRDLQSFLKKFIYRMFDDSKNLPLSIKEVTTFLHFPQSNISSPQLKVSKASTAPAPIGLSTSGTLLGLNTDRNNTSKIFTTDEDRLRHFYVIGQTGTGKTTLLKNMITQDILAGNGVCMIDPHGSDIQDILAIIPKERYDDVIYFDPGYAPRPMALNMLEYDKNFPEQKTFVVNELLSIFNKLFDMKTAGGPMFEQYFRNAVLLVMDDPETGNTLLDVSRVLSSKPFRELKLLKCKNPTVIQFWREIADKAGGEASLQNVVPYITSKFDVFLSNEIMRPIIAQEHSTFNFREVMDTKKILLVNLSKGRLGDINANLIGLILVGKILMAALSRADSFGQTLPSFYLYIDEFQNITTDSISQILSEARKYKLSLTIAHQFIAQLDEKIKDSVFGNVGSIASFRVGADDAEYLEKQFSPVFSAKDLLNLDNRNAYMKMLSGGRPVRPFSIETMPPMKGDEGIVPKLKELSYLVYGRDRNIIEEEIAIKYRKEPPKEVPALSTFGSMAPSSPVVPAPQIVVPPTTTQTIQNTILPNPATVPSPTNTTPQPAKNNPFAA